MAALAAVAYLGWSLIDGAARIVLTIGFPVVAAAAWGIFAVRNDPSRSGKTVVPVNGKIRLAVEAAFFGIAVWALQDAANTLLATVMGVTVVLHYAASYDRLRWLWTIDSASGADTA